MPDHLVQEVANTLRFYIADKNLRKNAKHPRGTLMELVGMHTEKPGFKVGERERYNAFIDEVLRELGWCTRHSTWGFYFKRDMSVGCKECDQRSGTPTEIEDTIWGGEFKKRRRWWGKRCSAQ